MSAVAPGAPVDFSSAAFTQYYARHIQPLCDGFDRKRQDAASTVGKRKLLAIVPALLVVALAAWIITAFRFDAGIVVGGFGLFVLAAWVLSPQVFYEQEIKTKVWPVVFAFFGPDFRFHPASKTGGSPAALQKSGVLRIDGKSKWDFSDRVTGTYRGVGVLLEELRVRREKKKDQYEDVFKGVAITLRLGGPMKGRTVLFKDGGVLGNFTRTAPDGMQRVRLEDPVFEKVFEVYAQDQIDARVCLTPSVMDRLRSLAERHGNKLECSFCDGSLHVFIATEHNYFEVRSGLAETVTFRKEVAAIRNEMATVFAIVDELKLHQQVRI